MPLFWVSLFVLSLLLQYVVALQPQTALAASVPATFVEGAANKSCQTLADTYAAGQTWQELKVDPPANGTVTAGPLSVTISSFVPASSGDPGSFAWSSNFPVDAVFVKTGVAGGNLYIYDPTDSSGDTDLQTPSGQGNGFSHISFCYDETTQKLDSTTSTVIHNSDHEAVTSVLLGTTVHDMATVTGSGEGGPTGTVTFSWFTNGACSGAADSTSEAITLADGIADATGFARTPVAAGSYAFQATYSGDEQYKASTGACEPLEVQSSETPVLVTTIHLGATDDGSAVPVTSITLGQTVHDSAALLEPAPSFVGLTSETTASLVYFRWFTNGTCQGEGASAGSAALVEGVADPSASETPTSAGQYSFRASYGDLVSDCEPLTVTAQTTVATTIHRGTTDGETPIPVTSITLGQTVHDSATVTGTPVVGATIAVASPAFVDFTWFNNGTCGGDGTPAGHVALVNGVADPSIAQTPAAAGTYSFRATYGDLQSACEPLTVTQSNPPCQVNCTPSPQYGSLVVSKTLAGDLTDFAGGTFSFTVACTSMADQTVSITLNGGTVSAQPINQLLPGITCTITENTPPPAGGTATWGTMPAPVAVTIAANATQTAAFVNTRVLGGVAGATGTPEATPPSTNTTGSSNGGGFNLSLIFLALAGLSALALVLTPAPARARR